MWWLFCVLSIVTILYGVVSADQQQNPASFTLALTIRDQRNGIAGGGDFDYVSGSNMGVVQGLVLNQLGSDRTPQLNPNRHGGIINWNNLNSWNQWYHDPAFDGIGYQNTGVNPKFTYYITMTYNPSAGVYQYNNQAFFPIDNIGWGNEGRTDSYGNPHNFGFCVTFSTEFQYKGGEVLAYTGDDSVWVFINNVLAVDIGGVHSPASASVSLDTLGLTKGQTYPLDFFFAEEHTTGSTILISTSFVFTSIPTLSNNSLNLNRNVVSQACSFYNSTLLDNSHSSAKDATIVPNTTTTIRITFLCSTVTTTGYAFGLIDPSYVPSFTDLRTVNLGGPMYTGAAWTSTVYTPPASISFFIRTPTSTYYSSTNGSSLFAQVYFNGLGNVLGIRFSNTIGHPYSDLIVLVEVVSSTWNNYTVPVYNSSATCTTFTPSASQIYSSSCLDFEPLVGGCSTYTIPIGWDIAPLDNNTQYVLATYGSYWPPLCYAVENVANGTNVGWSKNGSCTVTPAPIYRTINNQGQVCISTCTSPFLLRSLTVDTSCNTNVYGSTCSLGSSSSAYINSQLPYDVFVNLIQNQSTPVFTLPSYPVPSNVAILFVQDLTSATGAENVYTRQTVMDTCTYLSSSFISVVCSYAYYTTSLTMNYGFVPPTSFTAAAIPAQYTASSSPITVSNPLSPYQALYIIANDPNVGFPTSNSGTQNIILFLTKTTPPSVSTLASTLKDTLVLSGVNPIYISSVDYSAITKVYPFAKTVLTTLNPWTGTSTTPFVSIVSPAVTQLVSSVTVGVASKDDPFGMVSFPSISTTPLSVVFRDNSYSNVYTTVYSPLGGGSDLQYYPEITVCQGSGAITVTPANSLFVSPLVNFLPTDLVLMASSFEACSCTPTGTEPVAAYIATPPSTSRYTTFPDYKGPVVRSFGRGNYPILITTYNPPIIPTAVPSSCYSAYSNQVFSLNLFTGPSSIYGSEYNLNVKVVSLEWISWSSASSSFLSGTTGTSIFSNYSPYLMFFQTDKGASIYPCSTPTPAAGISFKTQLGQIGNLIIRYRLCDGCSCSPVSIVPVYITKLNNVPPVGTNFVVSVNASSSVTIQFAPEISDADDPLNFLSISFDTSSFPASTTGKLLTTSQAAIVAGTNSLISTPSVSNQNVTFVAGPYVQSVVIRWYVSDLLSTTGSYTLTINILPTFSKPVLSVYPSTITTPRTKQGTTTVEIDYNAGQNVYLHLLPPTLPLAGTTVYWRQNTTIDFSTVTKDTEVGRAVIPASGSVYFTIYFEAAVSYPDSQILSSSFYALTDSGAESANTATATNTAQWKVTANNLPVNVNAVNGSSFTQNTPVLITFTGTDLDSYDTTNLRIAFPVLPSWGTLSGATSNATITSAGSFCSTIDRSVGSSSTTVYQFFYTPFNGYYGADSFSWAFYDTLGTLYSNVLTAETSNKVVYSLYVTETLKGPTCTNTSVKLQSSTRPPSTTNNPYAYLQISQVFQILPDPTSNGVVSLTIANCNIRANNSIFSGSTQVTAPVVFYGSGPWVFTYNQNAIGNTTDTCYYFTSDGFGHQSNSTGPLCEVQFIQRQFHAPVATGTSFYTDEGVDLPINLGNPAYYYDADGDTLIGVTVSSLPSSSVGTLLDGSYNIISSVPYSVRTLDGVNYPLIFRPVVNVVGLTSNLVTTFDFLFTDSTTEQSTSPGIMTINVIPVNTPPTLTVNNLATTQNALATRNSTLRFTLTVYDIDSYNGTISFVSNGFPYGLNGIWSNVSVSSDPTGLNSVSLTATSTLIAEISFQVSRTQTYYLFWTPSTLIPDGLNPFFSVQASDSQGLSSQIVSVNLAISPNHIPQALATQPVSVLEDSTLNSIVIAGTDQDPWHNLVLSFQIVQQPANGAVFIQSLPLTSTTGWITTAQFPNTNPTETSRTLSYTPTLYWYGTDSFSYQFQDGLGAVSNIQTVTITVTHVNHPPVSSNKTVATSVNVQVSFSLVGTDIDNDPLTFTIESNINAFSSTAKLGTFTLASTGSTLTATSYPATNGNLALIYVPPLGLQPTLPLFSFMVSDGIAAPQGPYYVNVTIYPPINQNPPVSNSFAVSTLQSTPLYITLDSYVYDSSFLPINVYVLSLPYNGRLQLSGITLQAGFQNQVTANTSAPLYSLTYIPNNFWWGTDNFTFQAVDIYGLPSVLPGVATITVIHVDAPPVISVDKTSLLTSRTAEGNVTIQVIDIDSASIVVTLTGQAPTPSQYLFNGGAISTPLWTINNVLTKGVYQSAVLTWIPGILLPDGSSFSISVLATDTEGLTDTAGALSVQYGVVPNNPPQNDGGGPVTILENSAGNNIVVTGTDPDYYDKSVLSIYVTTLPVNGILSINGNPVTANYQYTYTLRTNTDGQPTTYTFHYTPTKYVFGLDSFAVQFQDQLGAYSEIATVEVNVTFVNTPPSSGDLSVNALILRSVAFTLIGPYDPDANDPTTLHVLNPGAQWVGDLTFNNDASFNITSISLTSPYTFVANIPWSFFYISYSLQTTTFQYYLTDTHGGVSPTYTVTIVTTTNPSNLPPVASNANLTTLEDTPITFDFANYISDKLPIVWVQILSNTNGTIGPDPPLGTLTSAVSGLAFGTATTPSLIYPVNRAFAVTFTPNKLTYGVTTFLYHAGDEGISTSNEAVITITIVRVNHPPTITVSPATSLVTDRTSTAEFEITLTDIDGNNVNLFLIPDPTLPLPLSSSTIIFETYLDTANVSITNATNQTLETNTTPGNCSLAYTPSASMLDGTSGGFYLQVCDIHGLCSTTNPYRTLGVVPNNLPVVVSLSPDQYDIVNKEGFQRIITLTASDPDIYHTTHLTFVFTALTTGGPLTLCDSLTGATIMNITTTPFSVLGTPDTINQRTNLTVCYNPLMFYLSDTADYFRFYVVDLAEGQSIRQNVDITTNISVPHPPTSSNYSLFVHEHDCLVSTCGTVITSPPFVEIFVSAPDATANSTYSIVFSEVGAFTGQLFETINGSFVAVPIGSLVSPPWRFFYQPVNVETGLEVVNETLSFVIKVDNSTTETYYLFIHIDPINDPPVGMNLNITSPENIDADLYIPHSDPDDPPVAIVVYILSVPSTNQATFYSIGDNNAVLQANTAITGWNISCVPNYNVYSSPATVPVATFQYKLIDHYNMGPDKAQSPVYTASFFVTYTYFPIYYIPHPVTNISENTYGLLTLDRFGNTVGWYGGNTDYQSLGVTITLTSFNNNNQPGSYYVCDAQFACNLINGTSLPVVIPHNSQIKFVPQIYGYGTDYSLFTFTVQAPTPVPVLTVTWTINVIHVNQPPVVIPVNFIAITNATAKNTYNYCNESTYFLAIFQATDIDSPLSSLQASWFITEASNAAWKWYVCSSSATTVRDSPCGQGSELQYSYPYITPASVAYWKIIMIPNLDYYSTFETVKLSVLAVDDYLAPSPIVSANVFINPINHAPEFVPYNGSEVIKIISKAGTGALFQGKIMDPDFVFGYYIRLTVNITLGPGSLGLPFVPCRTCELSPDNRTLSCLDKIDSINAWFDDPKGSLGVPFFYPTGDYLTTNIHFHVDDLGNVDYRRPPPNLTADTDIEFSLPASILSATASKTSSQASSIAVGVGLIIAVILGLLAAFAFRNSKSETDLYLAEFLSNMDTAGNNLNPMYTEATKRAVNPNYKPANG